MANGTIFINYRRNDTAGWARLLHTTLGRAFGAERIFLDVDTIRAGDDFHTALRREVGQSAVMLCLIGPHWLANDDHGRTRLDNPDDFVRIELEAALKAQVAIVPILVDGVTMPSAADLPDSVAPLVRYNALSIRPDRFEADAAHLVDALRAVMRTTPDYAAPVPRGTDMTFGLGALLADLSISLGGSVGSLWRAALRMLTARRTTVLDDPEAPGPLLAVETAVSRARAAGVTLDQIIEAVEYRNWDHLKDHPEEEDLEAHLDHFADGDTKPLVSGRLEFIYWQAAQASMAFDDVLRYLDRFPNGSHADAARDLRDRLIETSEVPGSAALPRFFINYRTIDSQDSADRIYEYLSARFSRRNIIFDLDRQSIPPSHRIEDALDELVAACDIMLVLIRDHWVGEFSRRAPAHEAGEDLDYVRHEIRSALTRDPPVLIVPVFLGDTEVPRRTDLPHDIQDLMSIGGHRIGRDRFNKDLQELVAKLVRDHAGRKQVGHDAAAPAPSRHPHTVAGRA